MADKPISYIQVTREFRTREAAMHYMITLRRRHGRRAKCFMKEAPDCVYVKARYPDDEAPIDLQAEVRAHTNMRTNVKLPSGEE